VSKCAPHTDSQTHKNKYKAAIENARVLVGADGFWPHLTYCLGLFALVIFVTCTRRDFLHFFCCGASPRYIFNAAAPRRATNNKSCAKTKSSFFSSAPRQHFYAASFLLSLRSRTELQKGLNYGDDSRRASGKYTFASARARAALDVFSKCGKITHKSRGIDLSFLSALPKLYYITAFFLLKSYFICLLGYKPTLHPPTREFFIGFNTRLTQIFISAFSFVLTSHLSSNFHRG
jgi:hypothetical protein